MTSQTTFALGSVRKHKSRPVAVRDAARVAPRERVQEARAEAPRARGVRDAARTDRRVHRARAALEDQVEAVLAVLYVQKPADNMTYEKKWPTHMPV